MASQKERMFAVELYIVDEPELAADMQRAAAQMEMFNASMASDSLARLRAHCNRQ